MAIDHRNLSRINNRKLVLQQLFNNRETSRAEIARQLNLNKSTVSSIYAELDELGLIQEVRQGESTSSGGRKPNLIRLNRNYGFVASFNIETAYMASMFNYINGEIIQYNRQSIQHFDILNIMQMIEKKIKEVEKVDQTSHGLLAISFSIHGIIYHNKVLDSPFLKLDGIDLQKYFENEFGVPVVLENEANLSAVFENDYCASDKIKDLITISIHRGIGVGVIANGCLYRGNHGMAGEIGRTLITDRLIEGSNQLVKVESLCSEDAIINQVKAVKGLTDITEAELSKLYHSDKQVSQIFDYAIELLAEASYNAIVSFGPQEVYFNSTLFENIPELFEQIKTKLIGMGTFSPVKKIVGSQMTSLLGASSLAIHRALDLDGYQLKMKWPKEVKNVD